MAGHSKWASIKHKKAATDAKRGQLFTKLARAITVAAREGGGDPDGNHTLAAAIEKAKGYSMPKDNIQRAIDRGTGEGGAGQIERVVYEGYGPGGAAVLVEALTDNRNRTGAEMRHTFDRHGGSLGEPGSVAWQFEKKGIVMVDAERHSEDDLMAAIDAGAEDVVSLGAEGFEVRTHPNDLHTVAAALEKRLKLGGRRITFIPKETVRLADPDKARSMLKLMDLLEDLEDVQNVHANFEIDDKLMDQLT
jgi:YebC/PmpR family DNA-binding regulatory protein